MPSLLRLPFYLRQRPHLVLLFFIFLILLFSLPRSDHHNQYPKLYPSPQADPHAELDTLPTTSDPALAQPLSDLYHQFTLHGPSQPIPEAVYLDPELTASQRTRYAHLQFLPTRPSTLNSQNGNRVGEEEIKYKYMIQTQTRQISSQLPDLLNTLYILTTFLGSAHVSFSILEGPSTDCTPDVLEGVLLPMLLGLGVARSDIRLETRERELDFGAGNRVEILAGLRNRAMSPLWDDFEDPDVNPISKLHSNMHPDSDSNSNPDRNFHPRDQDQDRNHSTRAPIPAAPTSTVGKDVIAVISMNDIFLHAADVLELLHQHVMAANAAYGDGNGNGDGDRDGDRDGEGQGSGWGITTGMDWWNKRLEYYYDIWVGRTLNGDLFYPISNPWWSPSSALFESHPPSSSAYRQLQPFQVYASWNGLAILSPEPFLPPHNVRFRRSDNAKGECAASECGLVCEDFWGVGWGRIQVVPSVQFAYEANVARDIIEDLGRQKKELGWVDGVPPIHLDTTTTYNPAPPDKVRCHPWPEENGLGKNVWDEMVWVDPLSGVAVRD